MIPFDYDLATPEQRNELCARHMPGSEVNPIRGWYLTLDGKIFSRLAVQTEDEARAWLRIVSMSRHNWDYVIKDCPYALRDKVGIREETWHFRYTDTPAGAWALVEQLVTDSWEVALTRTGTMTTASAVRHGARFSTIGDSPMPLLVGLLFLLVQGECLKSRITILPIKPDAPL